jgi:hypothetical protein
VTDEPKFTDPRLQLPSWWRDSVERWREHARLAASPRILVPGFLRSPKLKVIHELRNWIAQIRHRRDELQSQAAALGEHERHLQEQLDHELNVGQLPLPLPSSAEQRLTPPPEQPTLEPARASATLELPADQTSRPAEESKPPGAAEKKMPLKVAMRKLKLGDDYDRLLVTSLGSPKEMDALVHLKEGRHTLDIFTRLIERAVAGKPVSAIGTIEKIKDKGLDAAQEELAALSQSGALTWSSRKPRESSPAEKCATNYWKGHPNLLKPNVDWWPDTSAELVAQGYEGIKKGTAKTWRAKARRGGQDN